MCKCRMTRTACKWGLGRGGVGPTKHVPYFTKSMETVDNTTQNVTWFVTNNFERHLPLERTLKDLPTAASRHRVKRENSILTYSISHHTIRTKIWHKNESWLPRTFLFSSFPLSSLWEHLAPLGASCYQLISCIINIYLFSFCFETEQSSGRFLGITGWDPSVCTSNRLHVHIIQLSFI